MTQATDVEVHEALWRLAPGARVWDEDELARMRVVLAAATDEDALLAWSRHSPPDSPLRNVQIAAIRAVREAYRFGRARTGAAR